MSISTSGAELSVSQDPPPRRTVEVLVPAQATVSLDALLAEVAAAPLARPFDASRTRFLADLSRVLRRNGRGMPEIEALSFWLRKSEVSRLAKQFQELGDEEVLLVPRGTAFHIPPANVDTIFVYSLAMSMLTGNRNIVRLSSRSLAAAAPILDALRTTAAEHPEVAQSLRIVTYGHDDETTRALSAACDVRVIWGGDGTIDAVRRFPLAPHATELAFADRFSLAALRTAAYLALDEPARDRLVEQFVNDTFWFDQLGCSSARLLVWVGAEDITEPAEDFHTRVRRIADGKGYQVDTAAAIGKLGQAFRSMIDGQITGYHWYSNTEVVLDTGSFAPARGDFCGAGLFYQWRVGELTDLVPHLRRADQTLAAAGFTTERLRNFAETANGAGIDRIVPFGQALQFHRYWDGYDLLAEFTRKVHIVTPRGQ